VTDVDGNVTTIARDASGKPKAIVGPYGHRTELTLDGGGWLSQVKNPAGEAIVLTYAPGGLLASFTDARGGKHVYEYDDLGRLKKDTNPDGGAITLARSGTPPLEAAVRVTSALARTAGQGYQLAASGELRRESTGTDGKSVVSTATPDGGRGGHPRGA
jgi:YD repeat-containing protein